MSKINNTHGDGYHFDENFDISKFLRDKHTEERNNKRRRLDNNNNINNNNKNRQTFGVPFDLICGTCNQLTGRGSLVYMTKSPAIEEDNNNNLNNNNNNTSSTTPTAPPKPPKKKILKYLDKITIFDIKFKCKKCSAIVIIRTDYATPTLTGGYVPFYNCTRLSWGDEEDDEDNNNNNNNNNNIIDNISNNISISNAKTVAGVSDAERRASDRLRRDIEEGGRTILIRERSAVDYDAERDRLMLGIMNNNNTSNNNNNNNNNEKENEKESNNNNNSDNDINDDISNEYSSDGDMCWGSDGEGDLTPPHLKDLMANGSDNITDNRVDNNKLISNNNNNNNISNPSLSTKTDWGNRYQYHINNNKSINSNNNIPGNKSDESAEGTEALFARVLGLANSAGDNNNNNNNNNNNKAHEDRKRTRGKTQQHKTRVMSNEDFLAQL